MNHSPLPWVVDTEACKGQWLMSYAAAIRQKWEGGQKTIAYVEGPGLTLSDVDRRNLGRANADFIVRAANAHEALLAACCALLVDAEGMLLTCKIDPAIVREAILAVALATGKRPSAELADLAGLNLDEIPTEPAPCPPTP